MNTPILTLGDNISLDIETVGVSPGCGILSIGAVTFDLKESFYAKIKPESNHDYELLFDEETMKWWESQSKEAREEAFSGGLDLAEALLLFYDWFDSKFNKNTNVWSNGADFDLPILRYAYNKVGGKAPWGNYSGRCYRTLKNLHPNILMRSTQLIKHNAYDDARMQAVHAVDILATTHDFI